MILRFHVEVSVPNQDAFTPDQWAIYVKRLLLGPKSNGVEVKYAIYEGAQDDKAPTIIEQDAISRGELEP